MPDLKLGKLPDRTPVRFTITVAPKLAHSLRQYAEIYRATYGQAESVDDLIPFMLEAFLAGDHGFTKACKAITVVDPAAAQPVAGKRRSRTSASSPILSENSPNDVEN
jgi:hypothetical protein